jgi:cytochrome c oxidase subunit 2
MLAEVAWWPTSASTTAHYVDWFFYFLVTVCGSVGVLVAVLLIAFSIRYRRRPGQTAPPPYTKPSRPLEIFWTVTPLAIFMVMFVWGATIYIGAYRAPDNSIVIYGIGKQWMWKFQHPGGQREIRELHVAVGQPFKVLLTSEDVIHSFFVPAFRIHMDVLPGRYTSLWFQPDRPGTYHLFCSQYCGTDHSGMVGRVIVMEPAEYQDWLHSHAEGSAALEGRKTFLKYRCISCHSGDAGEQARAPTLEDLYGHTVHLRDGSSVIADEDYIRRHLYEPGKQVVAGWEPIMPTFKGQVSEEEIFLLIAYFKTLHKGQTPRRVERYPPPTTTPPINAPEPKR